MLWLLKRGSVLALVFELVTIQDGAFCCRLSILEEFDLECSKVDEGG